MGQETTRPSLLMRIRDPGDQDAWREFDNRYGELILRYSISLGLQYSDAEDVRQGVMMSLAHALPGFRYCRARGRFRGYLRQVIRNAVFRHQRRLDGRPGALHVDGPLANVQDGCNSADDEWEKEWTRHHYRLAMRALRETYPVRSVQIFDLLLKGWSVAALATEFRMSSQAVHKVKQRIRDRLKELITFQIREEDIHDVRGAPR